MCAKTVKTEVPHRLFIAIEGLRNAVLCFNITYLIINVFDLPSSSIT